MTMNTDMTPAQQVSQHPVARVARAVKRKTRITIYLDDEVLETFRNLSEQSGKGYQTLINAALRSRLVAPRMEAALAE
jgi:uncharacterized protein (DUF4415 family)